MFTCVRRKKSLCTILPLEYPNFQQTKGNFYIEAVSYSTEIGVRRIIIIWIIDKYKFKLSAQSTDTQWWCIRHTYDRTNGHRMHTCAKKKKKKQEKRNKNGRCIKVSILPSFSLSIHLVGFPINLFDLFVRLTWSTKRIIHSISECGSHSYHVDI